MCASDANSISLSLIFFLSSREITLVFSVLILSPTSVPTESVKKVTLLVTQFAIVEPSRFVTWNLILSLSS